MKLSVLGASSALIPQEIPTTCQQLSLQGSWNFGSMQVTCRMSLVSRFFPQGSDFSPVSGEAFLTSALFVSFFYP